MPDVVLKIDAETAKAIQSLTKFAQAQDKAESATRRGSAAAREHKQDLDGIAGSSSDGASALSRMATSAGRALSALGGISALSAAAAALKQHLDGIAQANREIAKSAVPLAMLYGGGNFDRQMIAEGAKLGMKPVDSAMLGITIPAGLGAKIEDFKVGVDLSSKMGVDAERAGDVLVAGISRGVGSERAADLTLLAAGESKLTANQMSRSIPATSQFGRMEEGLAAGAAISLSGVNAERIPELTKSAGKALANDTSKFAKTFALQGLTESDKIVRLRQLAEQSGDVGKFASIPSLTAQGLSDQEAEAIGMLIQNAKAFEDTEQKLTRAPLGFMRSKIADIRAQRPEIAAAWDADKDAAQLAALNYLGPESDTARKYSKTSRAMGAGLRAEGYTAFTSDNGEVNFLGERVAMAKIAYEGGKKLVQGDSYEASPLIKSVYGDEDVMGRLIDALESNTQATQGNTEATAGGGSPALPVASPRINAGVERDRNAGMSGERH